MDIQFIFSLIILIFSVVIHEVAHGYAAYALGDPTAKYADRLNLNPMKHIDLVGSVIIPLMLVLTHAGVIVGWAKPVPVNPYNLRHGKWGEALVSAAGPGSNLLIALVFGLMIRFFSDALPDAFISLAVMVVLMNIMLAIFNLIPMPPLDGSKILFAVLPARLARVQNFFERYGLIIGIFIAFFLWQYIAPLGFVLFSFITGVQLGY
jgi:Zn-dependent protease